MKTTRNLLGVILISIFALSAFAQKSNLTIKMFNNKTFKLVFDNQVFNNSSIYTIYDIRKGYHNFKVFSFNGHRGNNGKHGGNREELIFSDKILIPENQNIEAIISKFNRFEIIRTTPIQNRNGHGGNGHGGNGNGGHNGYGHGNNAGGNTGYNNYGQGNNNIMNNNDFNLLKNTIRSKPYDSSKLDIAKMALTYKWVNSNQVAELVSLLSFDSSRLELAKFAFSRTIDKENYFVVNNCFSFSSTSDELARFVTNGGH